MADTDDLFAPLSSERAKSLAPSSEDLFAPLPSEKQQDPRPAQVPGEDLFAPLPSERRGVSASPMVEEGDGRSVELTYDTRAPSRERKAQLTEEERAEKRKTTGVTELASGGLQRGWQSAMAIPESFSAVYHDLAGDSQEAIAAAQRAKAIEDEAPEALWELQHVRGLTDFGMWLTERLGENAVNILGAASTAGIGGGVGALAAKGLALSARGRAAAVLAGANTGVFSSSTAFETSSTMLELFKASKGEDVHGGLSLAAGMAKGALELPTIWRLMSPWKVGGEATASFTKNLGKTMGIEALTEVVQEDIDILAHKYVDNNYSYFGSEALWRRAEAGVAGASIGGIFGAPSAYREAQKAKEQPDESGLKPGEQRRVIIDERGEPVLYSYESPPPQPPAAPSEPPGPQSGIPPPPLREAGVRVRGVTRDVEPVAAEEPGETPPPEAPPGTEPVPQNLEVLRLLPGQNQVAIEDAFARTVMPPGPAANEASGQMSEAELQALFRKREEEEADPQSERNIRRQQVEQEFERWEAEQREWEAQRRREQFQVVEGGEEGTVEGSRRLKDIGKGLKEFFTPKEAKLEDFQFTEYELAKYQNANPEARAQWRQNTEYQLKRYRALLQMRRAENGTSAQMEYAELFIKVWEHRMRQLQQIDAATLGPWDKGFDLGTWRDQHPLKSTGPVTEARNIIMPPDDELSMRQSTEVAPQQDLMLATPLIKSAVPDLAMGEMLDVIEADTPRYVVIQDERGNYGQRVYTDTDLEFFTSSLPQGVRPKVVRVHQQGLQIAAISADVFDLPAQGSNRIYFLKAHDPEVRKALLNLYDSLRAEALKLLPHAMVNAKQYYQIKSKLEEYYNTLLTNGLRVVPSRGASFYYDGRISGDPTDVRTTGRSRPVNFMRISTGTLFQPHRLDLETSLGVDPTDMVAVALDLNKFRPGEVSVLPWLHSGILYGEELFRQFPVNFTSTVKEADKEQLREQLFTLMAEERAKLPPDTLITKWSQEGVRKFRALMQKGIYMAPDPSTTELVTLKAIDPQQLTFGFASQLTRQKAEDMSSRKIEAFAEQGRQVGFRTETTVTNGINKDEYVGQFSDDPMLPLQVESIHRQLKPMVPIVNRVLKALGIDGGVLIEAAPPVKNTLTAEFLGDANMEEGRIRVFATPMVVQGGLFKVYDTLMHELGHIITFHYYSKLPIAVKEMLQYAYNKAMQVRRAGDSQQVTSLFSPGGALPGRVPDGDVAYFSTFVEWLAEQLRRWAGSQEEVTTELDKNFKEIADKMEFFYREWEKAGGERSRLNVSQPSYFFSAVMQYLRNFSIARAAAKQKMRQQYLYDLGQDVLDSPVMLHVAEIMATAVASMGNLFPPGVLAKINAKLDDKLQFAPHDVMARYLYNQQINLNLIELAVGSLTSENAKGETRIMVAHELVHAYRQLGVMSDVEFESLYRYALKDGQQLTAAQKAVYTNDAYDLMVDRKSEFKNLTEWENAKKQLAEKWIKEETVAYYIGSYANTGFATAEAKPMLEKFLAFIRRTMQMLFGAGWQTREQLLRSFFSGEMLERSERAIREEQLANAVANTRSEASMTFDNVRQIGNYYVSTGRSGTREQKGERLNYYWFEEDPNSPQVQAPVGIVRSIHRGLKGYDIEWIDSKRTGLGQLMVDVMEKDTGRPVLPSGVFTPKGFQFMKIRYRKEAKYYVRNPENGDYFSPNEIDRQLRITRSAQALVQYRRSQTLMGSNERRLQDDQIEEFQKKIDTFEEMRSRVPADIYKENAHMLERMFMLPRNYHRDEVQGSMLKAGHAAEENKLLRALGETPAGPPKDAFTMETEHDRKTEAYKNDGTPRQTETRYMRKIIERVSGLEVSEENKKYLRQTPITQEADRIGWFTRMYWGLHQLVWRNPHVLGLLDYMQFTEMFNQVISRWHHRADEVARAWDQSTTKRKEISYYLFWAMEMEYLSPQERAAKVVRHPHRFEREAEMRRLGLSPEDRALVAQIEAEFAQFLNEVEQVSIDNIRDTVSSPVAASAAIMEVQAEMQKLRAKPYFPITRFGRHTITVRDALNHRIVKHFEVFDTFVARDAAIKDIASRPEFAGDDITVGRVPEAMFEFMGLPAPLIRLIREKMPNLDPQQQAWLENFERLNLPDRSFRKRWKPAIGTPGHSMDGFRVYVHYFMHGSRYLARMKYGRQMSQAIGITRGTLEYLPSGSKRRLIVDYMTNHYNYIMEGGKDWSKFKAFVSWWQLGFSPAAAAMNLTQTPVVSWPFLAGTFGTAKGTNALLGAMNALRKSRMQNPGGTGNFFAAWEEMKEQGRIDIGQAAELGAYANGVNLLGLLAGTKRQKFYRKASYYGMWMFQKAEEANRSIMFKAAWELAMQNPNNKRLKEIEGTAATAGINLGYSREIADLRARLNFTQQEAIAFIFAKEAIDQTQGIYAPYSRPPFMRNPLASTVLIFYQYMQMMSYVYRYNPGTVQLLLISMALYGMLGLPGAEDLNELIRLVSQKLFGTDWDPKLAARKHVVDITKGTVLEEVGPDLFLHGISRYGFGLGLLPEGWALGKFDASANGSLGKTVPGLYEALHGVNVKNKPDQYISDVMQRLAGAGFGFAFNFLQWGMENPGSVDSKKWESMLPRSARSVAKAYRLYSDEGETTRSGAKLSSARFDIHDPEDLAALGFQAIGFASTKVNATWELLREQRDQLQIYQAERAQLYGQMAKAVQSKDQQAIKDVSSAIRDYNNGVKELDPSMQISTAQVMQAMRNRERAKALQEQLLPGQRGQIPVARRLQEMFPNVKAERLQFERNRMNQPPTE